MADSVITVDGLTATGGVGQVTLTWNTPVDPHTPDGLTYLQLYAVEVYAGSIDDFDAITTVKLGETTGNTFIHAGLVRGATFYYWVVPKDRSGLLGERFPASGGIVGMELTQNFTLGSEGHFEPAQGMIEQWGVIPSYPSLPALPGDPIGIDFQSHRVVTFPIPFPTECVHFIPIAGPYLVDYGGGALFGHPVQFGLHSFTPTYAAFIAYTPTNINTAGIQILPADIPVRWRALGY